MELLSLESIVTTQLKVRVSKILNNKFPNITFTNEISDDDPIFPNVYIHELEPSEVGNSIANDTIHAVRDTIQIEATSNTTKSDARDIINACVNATKVLKYAIVGMPVYTRNNNLHRYIIRVRRIVANGDNF